MGKKGKKNRFNQVLDIDISYSSNSVGDSAAPPPDFHLSKEKVNELQLIKAQLPSAPQSVRLEEDIARIPDSGPFQLVLVNISFSASRQDIENFFLPIRPRHIRIAEEDGHFRGFCFVDFATKADLYSAMKMNNANLLSRRVTMRIADQNDNANRRSYGGRDSYYSRSEGRSQGFQGSSDGGGESSGWIRRAVRAPPQSTQAAPVTPMASLPERNVIRLTPCTKNVKESGEEAAVSARHVSIFGAAKPVDIAARERELDKKMAEVSLEIKRPQEPAASTAAKQEQRAEENSLPPHYNAWSKPLVTNRN